MLKGSLEVIEFEPRQVIADAAPPKYTPETENLSSRLRIENRTVMSCAAALAALALHALLLGPAVWAGGASRQAHERKSPGDTALQWVVLEDSAGQSAIMRRPLPAPTLVALGITEALWKLPLSTLPINAPSRSEQPDGQSGLGAMSGRYLGQIQARVDRAWLRPRTAIGAPIFQCQVQVDQDSSDRVLAITLVDCNGGTRWQLSLVHAIEAASPLPPPPNPAIFVHHVLLTFRALGYSPGAAAQLYEPAKAVPADYQPEGRDIKSRDAFQALGEAVRARSSKGIELRIEGSKVEVEPDRQ